MDSKITRTDRFLPRNGKVARYTAVFKGDEILRNEYGVNVPLANFPKDMHLAAGIELCITEGGLFGAYNKPTAIQNSRLLFLDAPEEGAQNADQTFVLTVDFTRVP